MRADFTFDHERETGYALIGAHEHASCLRCHNDRGPVQVFARRGCAGCHEDPHAGSTGPICAGCHREQDWRVDAAQARHAATRFPLVGAHAVVACTRCHPGVDVGNVAHMDVACESCHASDLQGVTEPDHVAANWTTSCERCHGSTTWSASDFSHAFFPLVGQHASTACSACHLAGVFEGLAEDCKSCHVSDYAAATEPNHPAAGFPTICEPCHTEQAWSPSYWPHPWYLEGAHVDVACTSCHTGPSYPGTPSSCQGCHLLDYDATRAPNHELLGLPFDCVLCHDAVSWQRAQFDHSLTRATCVSCHQSDYDGALQPPHVAWGLPIGCEICHDTDAWKPDHYHHGSFPIERGAHAGLGCIECHTHPGSFGTWNCLHCHAHQERPMARAHKGVRRYAYDSKSCYFCHTEGVALRR